jgi:hypothetical protein
MTVTTYTIKQLGIVSVGKFFAVLGVIWGFFTGFLIAFGLGEMGPMMGTSAVALGAGIAGLVFMIFFTTIIGGVFGFVGGAVVAIVYNLVLGATGGIEMDLEVKS